VRLEDLTVALRPRQPWEAVDLGCALVRRDFIRILALWASTVVPVWIVLGALLWEFPSAFGIVVWWLKPLYDRVPLHFISQAAFGVRPGFVETWKQWPRLWSRFLFSALIWRRFSFMRSFALPVLMLEGQRGKAAFQRVQALATDGGSSGCLVSYVFLKLELVVFLGLWSLTSGLAPEGGMPNLLEIFDGADMSVEYSHAFRWYINGVYLFAITAIEPFFVGAGFGLYLNSRTHLEGWDVELTFRRIATRLRPVLVILLLGWVSGISAAEPLSVKEPVKAEKIKYPAELAVEKILAHPDFKVHSRVQKKWVSDDSDEDEDVEGVSSLMAFLMRGVFWLVVVGLISLVVYLVVSNRHLFSKGFRSRPKLPHVPKGPRIVMGMDISRESLPADIISAARAAWQAQRHHMALSLLYRGSLSRMVEQRRLPIRDSDTEDDCLEHVLRSGPLGVETAYFSRVTGLWMRAAYAGQDASSGDFDQLCSGWPFDVKSKPSRASQALLLLLPMLLMTACGGHLEDVEKKTGYKGKARTECFLAAQQLLKEFDYEPERRAMLDRLPDDATGVMILSAENAISGSRAKTVLNWVHDGGHLIYVMAGASPYNDWGFFSSMTGYGYFGNDERPDSMLKELKVEATDSRKEELKELSAKGKKARKKNAAKKVKNDSTGKQPEVKIPRISDPLDVRTTNAELTWDEEKYVIQVPDFISFHIDRELSKEEYLAGTKDKAYILGLRHGSGRVTLLNHARPLRNRYLGNHDHARWFLALMGDDASAVWFISGMEKSFAKMLWDQAWMLILSLVILLIFWLWLHVPRFGPMRQVALHETKHFVDHISALGHFFHRMKRDDVLLHETAQQVRSQALVRFPQMHGAEDAALVPKLAEVSGLSSERVQVALQPPQSPAPYQLVSLMQDLQTLRQSL